MEPDSSVMMLPLQHMIMWPDKVWLGCWASLLHTFLSHVFSAFLSSELLLLVCCWSAMLPARHRDLSTTMLVSLHKADMLQLVALTY